MNLANIISLLGAFVATSGVVGLLAIARLSDDAFVSRERREGVAVKLQQRLAHARTAVCAEVEEALDRRQDAWVLLLDVSRSSLVGHEPFADSIADVVVASALPIVGATGSPLAPVAVL